MTIEAMKQALEYLDSSSSKLWPAGTQYNIITALRAAIEAAERQETKADGLIRGYINALVANRPDEAADATKRMVDYVFNTTPAAQRQWVGLTDEEVKALPQWFPSHETAAVLPLIRAVEAKLREKNT